MSDITDETFVEKAYNNVEKWGLQDIATLLMATQEELGELAEEMEPHVELQGDDTNEKKLSRMFEEVSSFSGTVQKLHEEMYEDADGNPLPDEERPAFEWDGENFDNIYDELRDTAALLYQLKWALKKERLERS